MGDVLDFARTDTFTMEAWVKTTTATSVHAVIVKMAPSTYRGYDFYILSGHIGLVLSDTYTSNAIQVEGTTLVANGFWHHIAVTYDGSGLASGVELYVDGNPETENVVYSTLSPTATTTTDVPLMFGRRSSVPASPIPFSGIIDEVRIYNIALSSTVVHAHSHLDYEPPTAFASGSYNGNEGSTVTLTGSATDPEDGPLTYEWDLDNDGSYDDATGVSVSHSWDDNGVYTIGLEVTDAYGLTGTDQAIITVLNVPPTVGAISGAPPTPTQDKSVSLSASFTDPGVLDTHTAVWDWGDEESSSGTVTEVGGSGSVSGSHTYAEAGVYTVTLTVTDKDNGIGTSTLDGFIIVYDPTAGFVTGGGWIYSPASAYTPNIALEGKATFGFVSKYQKGAIVPTGNTEFQFRAAGMNFKSTNYDWLVVAGTRAQYKGTGTINGAGNYGFMLTAIDGGTKGSDMFRIKIWDKATDDVVYDNQMGASDTENPTTTIAGGSIVVHK
jgi:PKD repeat protein